MEQPTSIPVPTALRELIISSNQLLQNYQQELSNRVVLANREMMAMLGLNPQDGWQLDVATMTYVKGQPTDIIETESEQEITE